MSKGKIIVVEGACDGIGKSTQVDLLRKFFANKNVPFHYFHFPSYGTIQGKPVEDYLKGKYGNPRDLSPYFVNMLYANDRAITWQTELKKHYDNGEIILLDRYTTSSLIYQSALIEDEAQKRKFLTFVCALEYNKLGLPIPDKVLFLTAPFELVTNMRNARKNNEGVANDIHERDLEFMKKVYDSAQYVANMFNFTKIECADGEKMKSTDEIHNQIVNALGVPKSKLKQ